MEMQKRTDVARQARQEIQQAVAMETYTKAKAEAATNLKAKQAKKAERFAEFVRCSFFDRKLHSRMCY
jgi:hypothetical protein